MIEVFLDQNANLGVGCPGGESGGRIGMDPKVHVWDSD